MVNVHHNLVVASRPSRIVLRYFKRDMLTQQADCAAC